MAAKNIGMIVDGNGAFLTTLPRHSVMERYSFLGIGSLATPAQTCQQSALIKIHAVGSCSFFTIAQFSQD